MDIVVGELYQSASCGKFVVTEIRSSKSVDVEFVDTGYVTTTRFDCIRSGGIKDRLYPSVHGFGFIGVGVFPTSENGKNSDAYLCWQRMIGRCYDKNYIHAYLYQDCSVCDEWRNFQAFAEWFYANKPNDGAKYHLDKDIKVKGNKVYSPATCSFVTCQENVAAAKQKSFSAISPSGEVVMITNLAKFCREKGLNKSNMHKVITGKFKSCKGWTRNDEQG